ncbi:MAG: DNA recombination protein RmuC [Frankiaceae bacterium]|nr:DNA recombination protein RmuC [Frankiaceae bacterium]MBV9872947.1 DNA recombination protein RmuC [Frankiaceae bacterium]
MDIAAFLIALVTLAAGVVAGFALAKSRIDAATSKSAAAAAAANASLAAQRDAIIEERDLLRIERDQTRAELHDASSRLAGARARIDALEHNEEQVKNTFARMSAEALERNNATFLERADAEFKRAGAPIAESLDKVGRQLTEIEKERAGAQAALRQQIEFVRVTGEQLKAETASLVSALRKPQARGQWGELQLRKCVEYAGMLDRCDFAEQATIASADGILRPDLVVNLVGGKSIVVDSKVTLVAYLDAHEASDDSIRAEHLTRHARHLKQHVDGLAAKAYWSQFSATPEFVIMFVPGDGPLNAALEQDPTLLEYAISKRVHILGPMSLVPTLRAIAYSWQQQALADNAREVFDLGREMYKRLGVFGGHMDKLGRSLASAVKTYNDSVGSLERNVLSSARKFTDLEFTIETIESPPPIEEPVRQLAAGELIDGAERARPVVSLPVGEAMTADDGPRQLDLDGRMEDYGIDVAPPGDAPRRTGS